MIAAVEEKGIRITVYNNVFYTDINECEGVNECEQMCINTDGSHECSCRQGFELAADARSCNGKHLISIFSHTV